VRKLDIYWHPSCTHQVRAMNPWLAESICKEVHKAAATGEGDITRIKSGDPHRVRIRVQGAAADARVDRQTFTLYVFRIFPLH